jgi:hypothetical protein
MKAFSLVSLGNNPGDVHAGISTVISHELLVTALRV